MTDRSTEVLWGLTKKFNCFKTKWNGKHWSHSPFSMNGFHNAGQASNTIGVTVRKDKTDKNFKRTFTMTLKHKAQHGIKKVKKNSQSSPAVSAMDIGRSPKRAAKIVAAQRPVNPSQKNAALKKLAALARSTNGNAKAE